MYVCMCVRVHLCARAFVRVCGGGGGKWVCVRIVCGMWLSGCVVMLLDFQPQPALTGNIFVLQHLLPTPIHPAVMCTWNFLGCKFTGHGLSIS